MMIKNTKSFIEFCKEIGIVDIIGKNPRLNSLKKKKLRNQIFSIKRLKKTKKF